jgi:hypothetical protein
MFSIFQKLIALTTAAFSRGARKTIKQRLRRSREVIIETSDQAWVNSNANPLNKADSHASSFNQVHNPRATGTRWSKLHGEDKKYLPYKESLKVMALEDDERREALRRSEIVREQLQKRGQIVRNLQLAELGDDHCDVESTTQIAAHWSPSESLTGEFCSLEVLAEIEKTDIEDLIVENLTAENLTAQNDHEEMSDKALEDLAIRLLRPSIEPVVAQTPAQIAAQIAARAAATVQAKTHARLQALQAIDQNTLPETLVPKLSSKPEHSIRPPKLKIRDTEIVPSAMRERKITATKLVPVEYKATIQPSEEVKATDAKESAREAQINASDKIKRTESDTHEKIEERFVYRTSPEHALKLIAQNIETPAATLARLAGHENPHIRTAIARNQSANSETLWLLARDYEASIRYSLAESIHTPLDILRALTKDRNQLVAWVAQNSLNNLKKKLGENAAKLDEKTTQSARERIDALLKRTTRTAGDQDIAVLEMTARADTTSPARLGELANHENARIRAAVAENSNTPLHALWSLVRDVDPNVKIKLTFNCNCPIEILEVIKGDKDSFVAQKAKDILKGTAGKNGKFSNGVINAARNQIRTYLTWP